MVEVLDWSHPVDVDAARVLRSALRIDPTINPTPDTKAEHLDDPGFGSALVSSFLLNNTVATGIGDAYHYWSAGDKPEDFDPKFNPRTWISQNLPKETLDDLHDAIGQGLFDDVPGPNALQRKVAGALHEKNLLRGEAGSWLGSTVGTLAGAFTDPLTYLPVAGEGAKFWQTGSTAIRLGKAIFHAAAQMAPQEAALWSEQDFRSWRQSLLNVGVGGVLGGGVGFFARTLLKDNPFNPERLDNPLRVENVDKQGARTIVPGEGVDDIPHATLGEPLSAGAAAVEREAPTKLGQLLPEGLVTAFTPAGRALQYASGSARDLISRLLDNSAIYRNTNRLGEASAHSAEDIRDNYLSLWHNEPKITGEALILQTQKDLGEIGARRLDAADFSSTTQKLLTKTWTPEAAAELTAKYGADGAAKVKANAEQFAAFRERINGAQEKAMRDAGVIRDDAKVEGLKKQIDTLREQRDAELLKHDTDTKQLRETSQEAIETATKNKVEPRQVDVMRRDLREKLVERDAGRRQIHEQFDEAPYRQALNHQLGLSPALGAEYGHAQLWEPGRIARTQEQFRNFLFDVLKTKPDEAWLMETHNLSAGEFDALKVSDPARYNSLMEEWAGEEHNLRLSRLQNALEDARQREKLSKLDLNDTLRSLGILKRNERQIEVREYGRYRDQLNAQVAAQRELSNNLRKEEATLVEAATAARQQGLDRLLAVGEPEATTAFARQAERAQQVARQLSESEGRLNDLLDAQLRAERAYTDARDLRARRKDARQAHQEAAKDVLAQRELASKNVGEVKAARRAASKATPLDEAVNDIMSNLMSKGKLPASALEAVVSESGRFKARRLILTPEQKIEAARQGWLRTDLPNILNTQDHQIAGHLGIREALDLGPGRTFESWADVEGRIRDDYQRLSAAKPGSTGGYENQMNRALKDLNGMKARLLQQTDPGADKDGWLMWAQKQMRQYNFLRYAPGMFPSALPDVASFMLQHRVMPMIAEHGGEALRGMTRFDPKMETEARRMLSASEVAIHGAMLSNRVNEGEMFRQGGIGAPGSMKNRITSKVDRVGEALSHYAGAISGLNLWDRYWKILSGLQMMHDLRDQVGRYAGLSELERTNLASLGIGEAEARRLQGFMETHGEVDAESKLWDPHLENWYGTREGQQAARDFRIAVQRDMNRSRYMPGMGDRPLIADKWYGKLFTQFQNFGFAFINRYMAPMLQRAVHFQDLRAAGSFAALMAAGAVTMTLKDATRGITPDQRWNLHTTEAPFALAKEIMDRSGLFGYLSPYVDAATNLSGLTGATRYERESTVEKLLGVNASLVGDAGRFAAIISGAAQGQEKPDKVIDKLTALAPFASLLRLGAHTYDFVNGKTARDPYQKP